MYPGYYTGIDGRRQSHYEDRMRSSGHCQCVHHPIISNSWDWYNNVEDTPVKQKHESKKLAAKKTKTGGAKTVGLFKFLRLSLAKSSISGVNSIASSKSITARILWTLVLIGCCAGFGYQTFSFLLLYNSRPSIVLTDIENDGEADFPAVTVCNYNRMRKSVYCENFPDKCNNVNGKLEVSESEIFDIMLKAIEENQTDLHRKYGHNNSMVQSCVFNGYPHLNETECLDNVKYIYDPDYGNCFVIPGENQNNEPLRAREADFWQEQNDLTLLLNIDVEEFVESKRDPGLILTLHPGDTYPDIHTDGRELAPGKAYSIGIQKTTIVYLPLPFKTNCTEFSELPWSPRRRHMTSRMCTVGCSQHYQKERCGFVTRHLSLFFKKFPWNMSTITDDQKRCAAKEEDATMNLCRSLCGIPCKGVFFESDESSSTLTRRDIMMLNHSPRYGVNDTYDNENLLFVRIFYKAIENRIFSHTPKYETMELFSYLGGYSGVWLGFSLLTLYELVEIIFATFQYFLFKRKKRMQQKKLVRSLIEMKKTSKAVDVRKKKHFEVK